MKAEERTYIVERIGQAGVVQLHADEFGQLSRREKIFAYYLYLASLAGRDIAIDQRHADALEVRDIMEAVYTHPEGIDTVIYSRIASYLKLFWLNNGFYDSMTARKFIPECTFEEFSDACRIAERNGAHFGNRNGSIEERIDRLRRILFDPAFDLILTNKTPGADWIGTSSANLYERGLTYTQVDAWARGGGEQYPLNSRVVRQNGSLGEEVWRAGGNGILPGKYAAQLEHVVRYLTLALPYAAGEYQVRTITLLMNFLRTGNPDDFRVYNIHWVRDSSTVDFQMGFIEVYLDPRSQKGEWEALPYFVDAGQTTLMQNLAANAQYFEDRAPWRIEFRKTIERSPVAHVVNAIIGTGGTGPLTPVGVNLPNEQAIREHYGSKSILIRNVAAAYEKATGREILNEFACDGEEIRNQVVYGERADNLHTALHEVIGHGSGKVSQRLEGADPSTLFPGYYNTLEETRADLVALWNAWDERLVDIGVGTDLAEVRNIGETMFQQAIRGGLTQLRRIGKAAQLEEDHMKSRQLIAQYIVRNSNAVDVEKRDGKTYYHIVDFDAARECAGTLLAEVMRIKAEGDVDAARNLIDTYALAVDTELRDEVQARASRLNVPTYIGFIMPELTPVRDREGNLIDVSIRTPSDFAGQMLRFSEFSRNHHSATELYQSGTIDITTGEEA